MAYNQIFRGDLYDPKCYLNSLDIASHHEKHELLNMLTLMIQIRQVEEIIADLILQGIVKCPCHLGIGQEGIAVGICSELRKSDKVFGTHRAHAHYLALGGSAFELFAEVLGRVAGCSGGAGGSMHLIDKKNGFYGSVPIVGGTIPIAVGAALAAKFDKNGDIAVCFFGDGAAEEGVLHEALNLAAINKLPVLFVCENNLYSSHLDIKLRQPSDKVSRYADAHHVDSHVVDGNDVLEVNAVSKDLIQKIRTDQKPAFIEAITYRWKGHVGPNEDIDVGVRRHMEDLLAWKMRDPIKRLAEGLIDVGILTQATYHDLQAKIESELKADLDRALESPYPDPTSLLNHVYS